jgi:spore maturation protein CgeB
MNILYLGSNSGTSAHRFQAMIRLGHHVHLVDPDLQLPSGRLTSQWIWRTGGLGLTETVRRRTLKAIGDVPFDLAWVDHGVLIGPDLVRDLKRRIPAVVCYNVDDPFGRRDGLRWRTYLNAVPFYDLLAVVREENVEEARRAGARRVLHVFRSADEVAHAPRELSEADWNQWRSDVVFVGTAFPERGPFFAELIRLGVPLTLYGLRYDRLPEWEILKPHWRPDDTNRGDGYAKAISAAKICLGLLSKGNRDLHTQRSLEIPAMGALFCAERTVEHSALFEEDREAVYWTDAEECAAKCRALLDDEQQRISIAAAGRRRYLGSPWQNMRVIQAVIDTVLNGGAASPMPLPRGIEAPRTEDERHLSRQSDNSAQT